MMWYLETGMRVLDAASGLLSRLQELAILGANDSNTTADMEAINLEAEAIADEFNRLMTTSTYKGKDVFVTTAECRSRGGRDAEMTFGIGEFYIVICIADYEKYALRLFYPRRRAQRNMELKQLIEVESGKLIRQPWAASSK